MLLVTPHSFAGFMTSSSSTANHPLSKRKTYPHCRLVHENGKRLKIILNFRCCGRGNFLFSDHKSGQVSETSTGIDMAASQSLPTMSTAPGTVLAAPQSSPTNAIGLGDGPILPGDTVDVQVFDAPELSVRALVSQSGEIPVPLLKTFHIAGMTSTEAASALAKEYTSRNYLINPFILITVQQSSNGITVLGEVRAPGIYPAIGKHRLIDVLARAGGPNENAAHVVEITGPEPNELQRVIWDPTFQENPATHVLLQAGQTVLVGKCGVVYMGGNLNKPGAYPLCGSRHTTFSEAIALAGGTRPSSYSSKTILMRMEQGTRTIRVLDTQQILTGKSPDFTLNSDDIVYIPTSALKSSIKVFGQAALSFAATVGAYRLQ